jgi:hypothetical protein
VGPIGGKRHPPNATKGKSAKRQKKSKAKIKKNLWLPTTENLQSNCGARHVIFSANVFLCHGNHQ